MKTKLKQTKKEIEIESALLNIAQRMKVSPYKFYSDFYKELPQEQQSRFKNPRQYNMFLKRGKINPLYRTLSNTDFVRNKKLVKKFGLKNDWDKDGVPNWKDCKPFNYQEQGLFSSIGKAVGRAVNKAVSKAKSKIRNVVSKVNNTFSNNSNKSSSKSSSNNTSSSKSSGGNSRSSSGSSGGRRSSSNRSTSHSTSNANTILNKNNKQSIANFNSQKGIYNKDTNTYTDNKGNHMSMTFDAAKKLGATITENAKINRNGGVTLNGVTYVGNAVVPNTKGKTANQLQKELQKTYHNSTGKWVGSGRLSGTMTVLANAKKQPLYNAINSNNYEFNNDNNNNNVFSNTNNTINSINNNSKKNKQKRINIFDLTKAYFKGGAGFRGEDKMSNFENLYKEYKNQKNKKDKPSYFKGLLKSTAGQDAINKMQFVSGLSGENPKDFNKRIEKDPYFNEVRKGLGDPDQLKTFKVNSKLASASLSLPLGLFGGSAVYGIADKAINDVTHSIGITPQQKELEKKGYTEIYDIKGNKLGIKPYNWKPNPEKKEDFYGHKEITFKKIEPKNYDPKYRIGQYVKTAAISGGTGMLMGAAGKFLPDMGKMFNDKIASTIINTERNQGSKAVANLIGITSKTIGKAGGGAIKVYFGYTTGGQVYELGKESFDGNWNKVSMKTTELGSSLLGFGLGNKAGKLGTKIYLKSKGLYEPTEIEKIRKTIPQAQMSKQILNGGDFILSRRGAYQTGEGFKPRLDIWSAKDTENPTKGSFWRFDKTPIKDSISPLPEFTKTTGGYKKMFLSNWEKYKDLPYKKRLVNTLADTPIMDDVLVRKRLFLEGMKDKELKERIIEEYSTKGKLTKKTQKDLLKYKNNFISDKNREWENHLENEMMIRERVKLDKSPKNKIHLSWTTDSKGDLVPVLESGKGGSKINRYKRNLNKNYYKAVTDAQYIKDNYELQNQFKDKMIQPKEHTYSHMNRVKTNMKNLFNKNTQFDDYWKKKYGSKENAWKELKKAMWHDLAKYGESSKEFGIGHGKAFNRAYRLGNKYLPEELSSMDKRVSKAIKTHEDIDPRKLSYKIKDKLGRISPEEKILSTADRMDLARYNIKVDQSRLPLKIENIKNTEKEKNINGKEKNEIKTNKNKEIYKNTREIYDPYTKYNENRNKLNSNNEIYYDSNTNKYYEVYDDKGRKYNYLKDRGNPNYNTYGYDEPIPNKYKEKYPKGKYQKETTPYSYNTPRISMKVIIPPRQRNRIGITSRKQKDAWQPIMFDKNGKYIEGDYFETYNGATNEGMIATDELPQKSFTVRKVKVSPALIKKARNARVQYKFKLRKGVFRERKRYIRDRPRENNFNWMGYMRASPQAY